MKVVPLRTEILPFRQILTTMDSQEIIRRLEQKSVKPTVNRILVYNTLAHIQRPVSLKDLETEMLNLDKSSIFRVLSVFVEHDVVHAFEDGRGIVHYELCHRHEGECDHTDGHLHFYCESCRQTFCLEDVKIPYISLPADFHPHSISFVIKGECPSCAQKRNLVAAQ